MLQLHLLSAGASKAKHGHTQHDTRLHCLFAVWRHVAWQAHEVASNSKGERGESVETGVGETKREREREKERERERKRERERERERE